MHFVSRHVYKMSCAIWLGLAIWLGSGLDQKFANCAHGISKLCSTFCRLHRLTNVHTAQHIYGVNDVMVGLYWTS